MEDCLIGQIQLFPYGFVPMGWALCNGQTIAVTQNQALFSLIGNKFGGNGATTFALPNLAGCEPNPNCAYYIATQGIYPSRS